MFGKKFKNIYNLGADYGKTVSSFALFAPDAKDVTLMLYDEKPEDYSAGTAYEMNCGEEGIWRLNLQGDYDGSIYMFRVTDEKGNCAYSRDPYAVAATAGGIESVVVDLSKTDPIDFEEYKSIPLATNVDAVVYELHVRDFSMDEEIPFAYRGKFLSLTEEGLVTGEGKSVGLDSLKELGITHVQLMPVYDSASVDECRVDDENYTGRKYNWGYDPHNYNVPEGAYATDVYDPYARIRECKEMVKALHKAGIGVIMDVVYNHTYSIEDGPFEKSAPGYYYRKKGNEYANGSACGNEVATEKKMVRAYIINSLKYWVEEYGMDGFRFDLMGLIDRETMEEISKELHKIRPDIILYGEPWQAGGSPLKENLLTLKGTQKGKGFGVFNDDIRDSIKGSTRGRDGAFVQGRAGFEKKVAQGIEGAVHTFAGEPTETVNYAGAHDDLNLWDKVMTSLGQRQAEGFLNMRDGKCLSGNLEKALARASLHHGITKENLWQNQGVRACVLANAIVLTAQGIPFFHAGDEMLRSKYGDANTYCSGDGINKIQWNTKDAYYEVFRFYREMITLRKNHPAFRMSKREMIEKHLELFTCKDGCISYLLKDHANGDEWKDIFVIYHGSRKTEQIALPEGGTWKMALMTPWSDADKPAGGGAEREAVFCKAGVELTGSVELAGTTFAVLYRNA